MTCIRFGVPRRVYKALLPRKHAHVRIRHVVMDVGKPFGLWIFRPHALRTAEIGNARFRGDAGAGQRDDARRIVLSVLGSLTPARPSPSPPPARPPRARRARPTAGSGPPARPHHPAHPTPPAPPPHKHAPPPPAPYATKPSTPTLFI